MILRTERLLLRPFIDGDFEAVYTMYKNPEICKYLLHEPWTYENAHSEFVNRAKNNELTPAQKICLAVVFMDKTIGDVSVWYTEMKDTVEIGYVFSPGFHGQGLATEALSALVKYLFAARDVHRIQANLDARNSASARLCERIGMRREAHFIEDYWSKGEWTDSFVYGMLKADLQSIL